MKTHLYLHAAALWLAAVMSLPANVTAQGTAFTYQGRLTHGESAATGLYEVKFALYDAATDGNVVGTRVTVAPVSESYASFANIAGGDGHRIHSPYASICGGFLNSIEPGALDATIAGGNENMIQAGAWDSSLGGGRENTILTDAVYATIPGGFQNRAAAYAFAAGRQAKAIHPGAFVWADATAADIASTNANSVTMRATGGFRFFTDFAATTGAELAPGSGGWSSLSDRNAKENFAAANSREILDKVAALPLTSWNYKTQGAGVRHLGPMAQDFHAAFGLGESDRTIPSVDADGVALAAIQGLNEKVEVRGKRAESRIQKLEKETAELKQRNESLEQRIEALERIIRQQE